MHERFIEPATSAPEGRVEAGPSTRRVVAAGMIGTVVEYFDFLVFATISGLVFDQIFFPDHDELVSSMLTWSTFAVGFLMRPLGGLLFSHIGDKYGRNRVLFVTLTMMGLATTAIGLLPTYEQIGVAAPMLLVALRVVQGLGVGGEYGGAALMVIEHAHGSGRRGLFGSLTSASASLGFLIASALMAALTAVSTPSQLEAWVWRVPFLVSAVLLAVGFYVRFRLGETPVMEEAARQNKTVRLPLKELITRYPRELLVAFCVPLGAFGAYYVVTAFSIPYAVDEGSASTTVLLAVSTGAQVAYFLAVLLGGYLSDRWGRRTPMLAGSAGLAVWIFAFFPLLLSGGAGALLSITVALILLGLLYGPIAAYLAETFGTEVRMSGLSFGYQVSGALAGGIAPVAATYFVHQTGSWLPVAAMVACFVLITFGVVLVSPDRTNIDLR